MGFSFGSPSSSSRTSQTDSNNSDSYNDTNSNNVQNAVQSGQLITSTGGVNITSTDGGLIEAGRAAVESALGLVARVVESGFGAASRATDIVAASSSAAVDQVAAANDRPLAGSLKRYGAWIAGGVLALIGLWLVLRKGK